MNRRRALAALRDLGRTGKQADALLRAAQLEGQAFTGDAVISYRKRIRRYRMKPVP